MITPDRRRSARHLLGATAEVHIGPQTVSAIVHDVSRHGVGLVIAEDVKVGIGEMVWILVSALSSYALTGKVQRLGGAGVIGVELIEVLQGDALEVLEGLPLADGLPSGAGEE